MFHEKYELEYNEDDAIRFIRNLPSLDALLGDYNSVLLAGLRLANGLTKGEDPLQQHHVETLLDERHRHHMLPVLHEHLLVLLRVLSVLRASPGQLPPLVDSRRFYFPREEHLLPTGLARYDGEGKPSADWTVKNVYLGRDLPSERVPTEPHDLIQWRNQMEAVTANELTSSQSDRHKLLLRLGTYFAMQAFHRFESWKAEMQRTGKLEKLEVQAKGFGSLLLQPDRGEQTVRLE